MSWSGPALTTGAWLNWLKLIVTSSLAENSESVAVSRKTYTPGAPKVTEVAGECESANVTLPGAVTMDHVAASVLPNGKPSSVTVPCKSSHHRATLRCDRCRHSPLVLRLPAAR